MDDASSADPTSADPAKAKARQKTANRIVIREMELEDISSVFSLGERLFTADKWSNLYRTWDEYEPVNLFSSDGRYCLVAEQADKIIGFVLGTLIEKRRSAWSYGYVIWLGVDPAIKRKGVGTRLVDRLTEIFIEDGARMMLADTETENRDAVRFFERQGFGHTNQHVYLSRNLSTHPEYLRKKAAAAKKPQKANVNP